VLDVRQRLGDFVVIDEDQAHGLAILDRMMRYCILGTLAAAALVVLPSAVHAQTLRGELVAQGLTFPVAFVQDPSMSNVQFIVEQGGRIRTLVNGQYAPDFLNLTGIVLLGSESGLLGLAFAPDYAASGRFYVNFTRHSDNHTVIARFNRSAGNPLVADPASRFDLVWPGGLAYIEQPFSNHNGGNLMFGPDGYLYIGMGDGGEADDPDHRAQSPRTLLGKMLRIDVNVDNNDPEGYDIPPNNPFLSDPNVLPEIWSFGLRNPWRWSFDDGPGGTGALVLGDVGQGQREEVNYEPAGAGGRNYGWRNKEGSLPYIADPPPYNFMALRDPIHEYDRSVGNVITGGVVYRGINLGAAFQGRYFFADFGSSRVWSLGLTLDLNGEATVSSVIEHTATLSVVAENVSSFGVDANGEVHLVNYLAGTVHRLFLDLATNGTFNNGMAGWLTFATPDPSYIVGSVVNGVFEFYRQPPPPGTTNQAVIFQRTGLPVGPSTPLLVEFYLGNNSTMRKRIAVVVSDFDFNDVSVCTFWLREHEPLRAFRMLTHTRQAWANATVSFYAATAGSDGGAYLLDNVSLRPDFALSDERTDCIDPSAPLSTGGAAGPDRITNGSFTSGLAPWATFGSIQSQVVGGVFEFVRPPAAPGQPAGVVLQATGTGLVANTIVTATLQLGNSSSVPKRVTVLLQNLNFDDLTACSFWLAPGQPLMDYTIHSYATQEWTNATVSIYSGTVGLEQWIRLDNVTFRTTPSQPIQGTHCLEPVTPVPGRTAMPLRQTRWFHTPPEARR
jgi:glucose/arabinose dehydrogenase